MIRLILISDIFGRTPALEALGTDLSVPAPGCPPVPPPAIVDPYGGTDPQFDSEASAYDYFTARVGLDRYVEILKQRLDDVPPGAVLMGFSVGAAALWRISDNPRFSNVVKGFCFYGSRIRDYPDVRPRFDLDLIFPRMEPRFNVKELIQDLSDRPRITCSRATGLHGFMNRLSPNFDAACYNTHVHKLRAELATA